MKLQVSNERALDARMKTRWARTYINEHLFTEIYFYSEIFISGIHIFLMKDIYILRVYLYNSSRVTEGVVTNNVVSTVFVMRVTR